MLFTSREVRWFVDGGREENGVLVDWFCNVAQAGSDKPSPTPDWQGRLDDQPDVYLLVPAAIDMGIKWREGLLQIKGRTRDCGSTGFGPHAGHVECWAKWSYRGLPPPWRELFGSEGSQPGIARVEVRKRRLLRAFRFEPDGWAAEADTTMQARRGVNAELTEVSAGERRCLTLGFEAFPDDEIVAARFDAFVSTFLASLETRLDADASLSYPAWLSRLDRDTAPE